MIRQPENNNPVFRLPFPRINQPHSNQIPTPSSIAIVSQSNATTTDPCDHFHRRQSSLNCYTVHIANSPAAKSK